MDPASTSSPTDDIVASALPALQWARVLQLFKDHGLMTAVIACLAWQIGLLSNAQSYMCGV